MSGKVMPIYLGLWLEKNFSLLETLQEIGNQSLLELWHVKDKQIVYNI